MNIKKILLLLSLYCCCCCMQACTNKQNVRIDKDTIMKETYNSLINPDTSVFHLTTANFVDTLSAIALKYESDTEPVYYVMIDNKKCGYEILVNDMPVFAEYTGVRYSTPFYLNDKILKNGQQTFTYRLFPVHRTMDDSIAFTEESSFGIRIYRRDNRTGFRDEQLLLEHRAEINRSGEKIFPAIGKNYYEHTVTFNARFPHEINGWSDGQDLTRLNRKKLEEEVLRFYHKQWLIVKSKDIEAWYSYQYISEAEGSIRHYYKDKNLLQEILQEDLDTRVNIDVLKMYPLNNYDMKFYGNNRVVCLLARDTDPENYEEGAIHFRYKDNDGTGSVYVKLYLYLPQGRELKADNFIIIR